MIPENKVKLALLQEYEKAMRYQDFYFAQIEVLSSLIRGAIHYYESRGLEIPDRQQVNRLVEGLLTAVEQHKEFKASVLPAESYHRDESDAELPEPAFPMPSPQYLGI